MRVVSSGVRLICALHFAVFALSAAPAHAADVDIPYQAQFVPRPFSWTGYYFGLYAGAGFGQSAHEFAPLTTGNFHISGALVGGTFGFNFEMANFVAGIEFDAGWANIKGTADNNCPGLICQTDSSGLVTLRGRLGASFGRIMPFLTGGVAFGEINPTSAFGTSSTYMTGAALGAGVEFALSYEWTAKFEYLHIDLGHYDCGPCGFAVADRVSFKMDLVRAGLNYKFDW